MVCYLNFELEALDFGRVALHDLASGSAASIQPAAALVLGVVGGALSVSQGGDLTNGFAANSIGAAAGVSQPSSCGVPGRSAETRKLVELSGIEPLTSSLRTTRSPN